MQNLIPKHVAIIMDGNGRWGKKRGLTRSQGHYAGAQAMERMIDASIELGIQILTLYAFSSENWRRPKDEVNYLMRLPVKFLKQKLPEFMKRDIKILVSGNIEALPKATRRALDDSVEATKNNAGLIVNFAFNYGGRDDILQAVHKVIYEVQHNHVELEKLDESLFRRFLYTKELPDPELVIRTGGEKRMSNFLLWQCSASELYFSDMLFPDVNKQLLEDAIGMLQKRYSFV
ncbi:isoprenyl transferase [Oceanobacillus sp. FSL K6-0127]|uniref:isoprenyl transferase n=1 Tax=Oceanobacillus sp. FSL K6-0127 TaxID=2921420 RepID=UPI0030ED74E8